MLQKLEEFDRQLSSHWQANLPSRVTRCAVQKRVFGCISVTFWDFLYFTEVKNVENRQRNTIFFLFSLFSSFFLFFFLYNINRSRSWSYLLRIRPVKHDDEAAAGDDDNDFWYWRYTKCQYGKILFYVGGFFGIGGGGSVCKWFVLFIIYPV